MFHSPWTEFRPGEPWKGYPNIDPETDPFVTPGSVINNLSINTVRDVDHLRDRNNGRLCVCFLFYSFIQVELELLQILTELPGLCAPSVHWGNSKTLN